MIDFVARFLENVRENLFDFFIFSFLKTKLLVSPCLFSFYFIEINQEHNNISNFIHSLRNYSYKFYKPIFFDEMKFRQIFEKNHLDRFLILENFYKD